MSRKIILIGGLLDQAPRGAFLDRLKSEVCADDEWVWIEATAADSFQPHHSVMNRLTDELRKWRNAKSKAESGGAKQEPESLILVKLVHLHGRASHQLYAVWPDPKLAPFEASTSDALIEWLRSPASDLFPPVEWWAGVTEAALVAILCKLLRNKSWNASVQGHAWTKEEDLLTQSPVARDDRPKVGIEANRLLSSLSGRLLLTKGAGQGKTPTEWSIDTQYLSAVKQAIVSKSLSPLREFPELRNLLDRIVAEEEKVYRLDIEIVTEKVVFVCRERG